MELQQAYDDLATQLAAAGIVKSNMFGMPILKLGRKPIAGLDNDGVNFRLKIGTQAYERARALPGAHFFQPQMKSKKGRVMKQWIVVPPQHADSYMDLAGAAIEFVATQN